MLIEERKKLILEELEKTGIVKISDLTTQLNSSVSSIRRDLSLLEEEGLLKRIHGGGKKIQPLIQEYNMEEKSSKNVQEKENIANTAFNFFKEGDVLFIDAGTTTHYLVKKICERKPNVQIVTNSIHHASLLIENGLSTIILGGQIKQATDAVIGAVAREQIARLQFNVSFLGMNGIEKNAGFTTPDMEEASIKSLVLQQSQRAYILADSSKFGEVAFVRVAELASAQIVTNQIAPEIRKQIEKETRIFT